MIWFTCIYLKMFRSSAAIVPGLVLRKVPSKCHLDDCTTSSSESLTDDVTNAMSKASDFKFFDALKAGERLKTLSGK